MSLSVAAPRSSRKPRGEGHARRAEILKAAERIFVEHGYEGATIRKIAEEVGLSSTALYMHFSDKRQILAEICREAFGGLFQEGRAVMATDAALDDKLRALLVGYTRFALTHPNAYRLIHMTRPSEAKDGAEDVAQALGADLYRLFQDLIARIEGEGRLKAPTPVAAQLLWAGVHGVVSLRIAKPYFAWEDADRLSEAMIDALFDRLIG